MNEKERRQVIEQSLVKDQESDSTTPSSAVSHGEQATGTSTSSDSVTVFHHSVSSEEVCNYGNIYQKKFKIKGFSSKQ